MATGTFECKGCGARREVTLLGDGGAVVRAVDGDDDDDDDRDARAKRKRDARLHELVRYATCPACSARDPQVVSAYERQRWRGRLWMAAFYVVLAGVSWFVPWLALLPVAITALTLYFRVRHWMYRRVPSPARRYAYVARDVFLVAAPVAWVVAMTQLAFAVPALCAVLALVQSSSSDPFADATEQLRFAESPYRG